MGCQFPLVIVPTKYYSTPTQLFKKLGINLIIWANHNLRSSITAMQSTSKKIFLDQSLINEEMLQVLMKFLDYKVIKN